MTNTPDDSYKELLNIIKKILSGTVFPDGKNKMPSIIGMKVFVNGDQFDAGVQDFQPDRNISIEFFDDGDVIRLQTELPPESEDIFHINYEGDKILLTAGESNEYKAEIPIGFVDTNRTQTHLKNGVLEIVCYKKASE